MENIIETLRDHAIQVIKSKEIDISRRCVIQKALLRAVEELEYAETLCKANNIKLVIRHERI